MGVQHLKPWKPGQSGNPGGRTPLSAEYRAIKALTPQEANRAIAKYARMTRDQLQVALQTKTTPMLEVCIASIFAHSAKTGDYGRLNFLLDRAIGKAPVVADDDGAQDDITTLSNAELAARVRALLPSLEKTG